MQAKIFASGAEPSDLEVISVTRRKQVDIHFIMPIEDRVLVIVNIAVFIDDPAIGQFGPMMSGCETDAASDRVLV